MTPNLNLTQNLFSQTITFTLNFPNSDISPILNKNKKTCPVQQLTLIILLAEEIKGYFGCTTKRLVRLSVKCSSIYTGFGRVGGPRQKDDLTLKNFSF